MKKSLVAVLMLLLALSSCCTPGPGPAVRAGAAEESLVSAFMGLADSYLLGRAEELNLLAMAEQVRSEDWEAMDPLLSAFQDANKNLAAFFFRPDGSYFRAGAGLTTKNVSDRPYFPGLMGGEKVFCFLSVSRSTGRKGAFMASPVEKGGRVVGAVGAAVFLEDLSENIGRELALPEGMFFFALAPDGRTTLHSRPERIFLDPRKQDNASIKAAMEELLTSDKGVVEYDFDKTTKRIFYKKSPKSGWTYAVGTFAQ